jgi:hypothetical protein
MSFKEFIDTEKLEEADRIKEMIAMNADSKVGQPAKSIKGNEISNTSVLHASSTHLMLVKTVARALEIREYYAGDNTINEIDLSKDEFNALKKIKI